MTPEPLHIAQECDGCPVHEPPVSPDSRASALIVGICLLGAAGTAAVCAVAHYGFGWGGK